MNDEVKPQSPVPHTPDVAPDIAEEIAEEITEVIRRVRPLRVLAIICVFVTLGAGALCWRLAQGPFHAKFLTSLLERSLSRDDGLHFRIGDMNMVWRGGTTPLGFDMNDVRVAGAKGDFMTISHADVGISPLYLLIGQLHVAHADINNLDLRVIRLPDGKITLTGSDAAEKDKPDATTVGLTLNDIAHKLPAIDTLSLKNTMIVFEDQKDAAVRRFQDVQLEMTQSGGFGKRSFSGSLTAPLTGMEGDSNTAVDFVYNADDQLLSMDARIDRGNTRRLIGPWLRQANLPIVDMLVAGRAQAQLNNDFTLHTLNFELKGADGLLHWPRSYGEGLEDQKLSDFDVEIAFDPTTNSLELKNASITSRGLTIETDGSLKISDNWQKMDGYLNLKIPVVAVDLLPAIWPSVWDSGARHWLVDRMDKGRFSQINVNVPLTATLTDAPEEETKESATEADVEEDTGKRWVFSTGTVKGTFGFTGVTIDYRAPMQPAVNTTGTGLFEGLALTLDIDRANIGGLKVNKGTLYFDDLITPGAGNATLHFETAGSVASVFQYLDKEPISYRKKVDLNLNNAAGNANMVVDVAFPTLKDMKMEDVHVKAHAALSDLNVAGALKGMTLAGGPFTLDATENDFTIAGSGTLDGQPARVSWSEVFTPSTGDKYASKLEADLRTNKSMRQKFIGTLEDHVDNAVIPASVSLVTAPGGKGTLKVSADLTPAKIDLTNPFNAVKDAGKAARVNLTGTLQNNEIQSIDTLDIKGDGLSLASGTIAFGRDKDNVPILAKANLKGLKIGNTDADIDAQWPSEYQLHADISGASFDARDILADHPEDKDKPNLSYDVALKLGELYVSDVPLEKVSGAFVGNSKGKMQTANLDASADGSNVRLRYTASGQPSDLLSMELDNAGAGLWALGITQRVQGGKLRAEATPMKGGQPGDMQGKLLIENFSVHQAPMFAKLINLMSIPGLLNILNQDTGLKFQRAEADMTWLNRDGGALLQLKDGSTSGASLGLTFEGEVNTASDQMAIQGTVVPMSEVSGLISKIPLVGALLTGGGKGSGIFAATYTMKGDTADPNVSVNPLSVLTPGILRRILFEGGTPTAATEAATPASKDAPLTKDGQKAQK